MFILFYKLKCNQIPLLQLSRVKKLKKSKGVTFEMFKAFYCVLFGGSDLERAMFFLDKEKKGVLR